MNQNQAYAESPIATRALDESVNAATECMGRAEYLLERLHAAVTGYEPPPTPEAGSGAMGLTHDADRLASRLQSFCADLERTSARIMAPNVKSLGVSTSAPDYAKQLVGRG